ncbi:rod shape-determining protein MreC [Marinoscillum sp. MHG1-6]|uniref:rod shape-determining protein MreC n=1 Tax=Marinoscillum sp. MHG1-6 TaxID=2959627 RepID=UPI0021577F00|nr:rod shape-determining protein MreC [Marinoscillum sp. MHG1-6]
MRNLLNFLYRFRTFGFFLLLEAVCAWLIISYNQRVNASFLNSSNFLAANINLAASNTSDYLSLSRVNEQLLKENTFLRNELARIVLDSTHVQKDSIQQFEYIQTKVISNTFQRSQNYFTLNAGSGSGLEPGMGIISSSGVVGRIKSVSQNFATGISLLHRNLMISSSIKRSNTLCTVQWDGASPYEAELKFIPRHIPLIEGDSIVTSGYNAVFPSGIFIGTISSFELDQKDAFYQAKVKLGVDFTSLDYAYVIKNNLAVEQDSLETQTLMNE